MPGDCIVFSYDGIFRKFNPAEIMAYSHVAAAAQKYRGGDELEITDYPGR
jgi:hypothetical protein